jgi:hypothetical protein
MNKIEESLPLIVVFAVIPNGSVNISDRPASWFMTLRINYPSFHSITIVLQSGTKDQEHKCTQL